MLIGTPDHHGGRDAGIRTWIAASRRWELTWPEYGAILEVGSAGADWIGLMGQWSPGVSLTAVDWCGPVSGRGNRIKGDILVQAFPEASFDGIAFISAIEHIGLGHYQHDPLDPEGDSRAFGRCAGWLKPGGWLYADVPYNPVGYHVFGTKCRIYDAAAIRHRLAHPSLRLDAQAWTNLAGDEIPEVTDPVSPNGGRPFVYCANLWRKGSHGTTERTG